MKPLAFSMSTERRRPVLLPFGFRRCTGVPRIATTGDRSTAAFSGALPGPAPADQTMRDPFGARVA